MKRPVVLVLLIVAGFALVSVPAGFYWYSLHPWQHPVNLNYYYQAKMPSVSPHDPNSRNNLAKLPAGYRIIDGVRFNVAGLIQLANGNDVAQTNNPYPQSVEGIPINRTFRQLHVLHGTTQGAGDQTVTASFVLHYADGSTDKLDIVYGQQVYDWWFQGTANPPLAGNTKIAWAGSNPEATRQGYRIRVFKSSFNNPKPNQRVDAIDYVSALSSSGPFLLALTTE